jgi:rod shape-determining protein MreC
MQAKLENQILREKLLLLSLEKETLLLQGTENKLLKEMLAYQDSSTMNIIPARIINRGLTPNINTVTIDIGSVNGVMKGDPVITPNGIIGKTADVSNKTSKVHLINDADFRIGVRFLPSCETGILRWKSNNICVVREVYKNSKIYVGDRVITSGLGNIFPSGLLVGTVVSVEDSRDDFQKIVDVKIDENISSLYYLFVIIDD